MARLPDAGAVKATLQEKGEALRSSAQHSRPAQALRSSAEQSRPALARLWGRLSRPDPRTLLAAAVVSLVASSLLFPLAQGSCGKTTAAQVVHFNITHLPLTSSSALIKPSPQLKSSLPVAAEETAFFQNNVATICEAIWAHNMSGQQLTGSLLVDCDTTTAQDTVDLCISAAGPKLFAAFPPPQQAPTRVVPASQAPPALLPHIPVVSRLLLPLLTLMQLALPLLAGVWLLGWLSQRVRTHGGLRKHIEREQGPTEEHQHGEHAVHGRRAHVGGVSPRSEVASDSQAPAPPHPVEHEQLPAEARAQYMRHAHAAQS